MCREFIKKSLTDQSPNIFRHYTSEHKGDDQLDASLRLEFPCIKQATALEDFENYEGDSSQEDEKNVKMGTLALYENDRISSCSSDGCWETPFPGRCLQRYEADANHGDDHIPHANAEWITSPSQPYLGSTRRNKPPALKSTGRGEDAFAPPSFLRIPADHVPFRSNNNRSSTRRETNVKYFCGTPDHSFRLAKRPVPTLFYRSKTFRPDGYKILQEKRGKQNLSNLMFPLF